MKHIWTYKIMQDLPAPPSEFIEAINLAWQPDDTEVDQYRAGNNQKQGKYLATAPVRPAINWYGRTYQGVTHRRRPLGAKWESWVKANIWNDIIDTGISYADGAPDRPTSTAHTDGSRDFSLIWSVDPGGPEAELAIWRHRDYPILWDCHVAFTDTKDLINLTVLRGNPGCWYLVNSKILHSTENLVRNRVGLQVSLAYDPWPGHTPAHECYTW
jgi:hypothetical protein